MNASKPLLLVLIAMGASELETLLERFDLLYAPDAAKRAVEVAAHAAQVRAVLTNGTVGVSATEIDAMPQLTLICALGVGHENIALERARARGIAVGSGAGTNADSVADHAMALLLAAVRAVPRFDRACREGVWRDALPTQPSVSHRRLGIVGMGAIGQRIARRGAGFEMQIGAFSRTRRDDLPCAWFDSVDALARWCDFLVVATPGGDATRHLIDADALAALGPDGYLVNIARGSVVDTAALAAALREGRVRGAGLDVYEGEPAAPHELIGFDNVVLTPHVAGTSPEAKRASLQRFLDNAERHFAGQPLVSPV